MVLRPIHAVHRIARDIPGTNLTCRASVASQGFAVKVTS